MGLFILKNILNLRQGGKIMKKASFFIVLGLAILLLFGCAGGGGPLGGVSEKPEGTWFVQLLKEQLNI